jgi:transcriptional regulator with GAF, ATPase, and Fis domain
VHILRVWRELFRRPRLDEAIASVAPILAEALGIGGVAVRQLDLASRVLCTVASSRAGTGQILPPGRSTCTSEQVEQLLAWYASRAIVRGRPRGHDLLRVLAGGALKADVVAGPLADDSAESPVAALLVFGPAGSLGRRHEAELVRLLEPFAAALAASRRLQELGRAREMYEADNRALLAKLDRQEIMGTIVGADAGFREVMGRVEQVAGTDAPVLLLGETGTGKEVVARAIHARSRRHRGPMLRVNCGAIPPGLVDSELFGHERGSFTGAIGTRAGWFERADGGTLFLDEVGELPLAAQVRLLRVLQDGTLERVGAHHPLQVNVRIVAATHRSLDEMVATGTFRADLWYRISVFPIRLPPLRERLRDIPALAAHFAWHAGTRIGGQPLSPAPDDVDLLSSYDWPGNVRELAAVIERAAILGNGRHLDVRGALGSQRIARVPSRTTGRAGEFPRLDAVMQAHIAAALQRTAGRIEGKHGAAALLGINPHTLRARMRKLKLDWSAFRGGGAAGAAKDE